MRGRLYKHLPDAHGERHPYLKHIAELRKVAPGHADGRNWLHH